MTTAAALVLSLGGLARAADKSEQNTPQTQTRPQVPQTTDDPAAGGATATQAYQEYLVSLKKCEPLNGGRTGKMRRCGTQAARSAVTFETKIQRRRLMVPFFLHSPFGRTPNLRQK